MESYINNPPIIADIFTNFEILDDFMRIGLSSEKVDANLDYFLYYSNKETGIVAQYLFNEDEEKIMENIDCIVLYEVIKYPNENNQIFVLAYEYSEEEPKLYIAESRDPKDKKALEKIRDLFLNYKLKQKLEKELYLKEETKKKIVKV